VWEKVSQWHHLYFHKGWCHGAQRTGCLITYKGKLILIGIHNDKGRYRIPLVQQRGHWEPQRPSKKALHAPQKANSLYDLPSIEQAIKWMHAVCGYPVKTTWGKAAKAGNFVDWPFLTEKNINRYYPETDKTPKGHMISNGKMSPQQKHKNPF
jgi:hypothetical protein